MKVKLIHNRTYFLTTNEEILTSKIKLKDIDNQITNIFLLALQRIRKLFLRK